MRSKNENPYATMALKSLMKQNYLDFVLYNVDSGSTDGTLQAIEQYNPDSDNIKIIPPEAYVPGKVLNESIKRADQDVIVLLNADCVPQDSEWLSRLIDPVLRGEKDAVSSRQIARSDAFFIVSYDLDRAYGNNWEKGKRHSFFSAAACAFRRKLWEEEAFPEVGWGEDFVWAVHAAQRGARFAIVVDSVVEHSHNYPLKTLYRREYGHGIVHHQALGDQPSLFCQGLTFVKHVFRDVLYVFKKRRVRTIPYNVVYRATCHWAHYRGRLAAAQGKGFPEIFFRS